MPVRVSSTGQIDLFENDSNSIGACVTLPRQKEQLHKNVNMFVQWTRFLNFWARNNPRLVDMPLKSINQSIHLSSVVKNCDTNLIEVTPLRGSQPLSYSHSAYLSCHLLSLAVWYKARDMKPSVRIELNRNRLPANSTNHSTLWGALKTKFSLHFVKVIIMGYLERIELTIHL